MIENMQREIYEHPLVVSLGPIWSALIAGYVAIGFDGRIYLTEAGQRYLDEVGK